MRKLLLLLAVGLACEGASAHLCNNIYRTPDRIIIKSEKDELVLETEDEVRIFVRNNYPTHLRSVRLVAEVDDPHVMATVTPEMIEVLTPGEKYEFTVRVHAEEGAPQGTYRLKLSVGADSFGFAPVHEITDDELVAALDDPMGNVSSHVLIAESLLRRRHPVGMELLQQLLQGDRGYLIRALRAAGRSGNPDVIPLLSPLLSQRDGAVRGNALLAVGMLKAETPALQAALSDPDPFVCSCAATGLLMAGAAPEGLAAELSDPRFLDHDSEWVRVAAAWGSAWAGNTDALSVLERALSSGDAEVVVFAGDALLCLADQQAQKEADEAVPEPEPPQVSTDGARALHSLAPDRLYAKIQSTQGTQGHAGGLEVQLYHSYPAPLHDVTISLASDTGSATSVLIPVLAPTEIRAVTVPASLLTDVGPTVDLRVDCAELRDPVVIVAERDPTSGLIVGSTLPVGDLPLTIMRLGDAYAFLWAVPLVGALAATALLAWRRRYRRKTP